MTNEWHYVLTKAGSTSLPELVECLEPNIVFGVELSDAELESLGTLFEDTRDRRTLIGQGAQDVVGFIRAMREVGFDGPWGVEILSAEHRQRPLLEALTLARDSALRAFEQADQESGADGLRAGR
jgi:sugar phosphate isomerase/epimerase